MIIPASRCLYPETYDRYMMRFLDYLGEWVETLNGYIYDGSSKPGFVSEYHS